MGLGQAAYVFGMHGVGSLVISGGINFGIACGEFLIPRFFPYVFPWLMRVRCE